MKRHLHWTCSGLLAVGFACGCQHRQQVPQPAAPGAFVPPPPSAAFPGQPTPQTFAPAAPAPGFVPPAAPAPVNPGTAFPPGGSQVPPPPAPTPSNYPPSQQTQSQSQWQPAPGSVQLLPPEPVTSESSKAAPPKITETKEPPRQTPPAPPPALPAGIPQFNMVKDNVAAGLRPSIDGGLDWLQTNGYRTVFHIRAPNEDDSADKKQVEARGMRYLSLVVSPETLSKKIVADFSLLVSDKSKQPLFVYDRDGALAGGLWYLHFRLADQTGDDAARVRAGALGFREERDDAHRSMWLAVQNLLKNE